MLQLRVEKVVVCTKTSIEILFLLGIFIPFVLNRKGEKILVRTNQETRQPLTLNLNTKIENKTYKITLTKIV